MITYSSLFNKPWNLKSYPSVSGPPASATAEFGLSLGDGTGLGKAGVLRPVGIGGRTALALDPGRPSAGGDVAMDSWSASGSGLCSDTAEIKISLLWSLESSRISAKFATITFEQPFSDSKACPRTVTSSGSTEPDRTPAELGKESAELARDSTELLEKMYWSIRDKWDGNGESE